VSTASFVQVAFGESSGSGNHLLTEAGDILNTESSLEFISGYAETTSINVTAGNYLDVLVMVMTSSVLDIDDNLIQTGTSHVDMVISPIAVDTFNDVFADNRQFKRYLFPITSSGSCVLSMGSAHSVSPVGFSTGIAAAEIVADSVAPWSAVTYTHTANNMATGGTNTSDTPSLGHPGFVGAWNVVWAFNGFAPTAGAGFTMQTPNGWTFGSSSGPGANYETKAVSTYAPATATSIAVSNFASTYVFSATWNTTAINVTLSGNQATTATGTIAAPGKLVSIQATFALGSLGVTNTSVNVTLNGLPMVATLGTTACANSKFVGGIQATFSLGSPTVSTGLLNTALNGAQAVSSAGTCSVSLGPISVNLSGTQALASAGSLSAPNAFFLVGRSGAFTAGSFTTYNFSFPAISVSTLETESAMSITRFP
jgi:hypothetical protein